MRAPVQRVIIEAPDVYNYFVEHGSLRLYVDPLFKKGHARIKTGIVHALPTEMHPWCKVVPELEIGDRVYFHYNALQEDNAIPDRKGLWLIDYMDVFVAVRDGKIIMIGGKVLVDPYYDEDVVEMEVDGDIRKVKVSKTGIITEMNVQHSPWRGTLAAIGTPLIGENPITAKVGDSVVYVKNGDFKNTVEGKVYFVMNQDDILATL